ncbi:MAG TPA: 3-isopropylmalate dehydrogenase [Longimicrobiales bacterium]
MRASIAVLPGDGVGPEVTAQALRALAAVAELRGHELLLQEALIGGAAIDATGEPLPAETVRLCQGADAVLLGAVGGPKWDDPDASVRPEQGLLGIRRELGLFANLRPVRAHPALAAASPLRPEIVAGVDLVFVRELTGGIYFGEKRRGPAPGGGELASDLCSYQTHEIERVTRLAAVLALARRGRLTSIDKANVMETSRLWRRTVERVVREEFPGLELEHLLVDAAAMHLLRRPAEFDVLVTENMFGDILTDEASMLAGSIGVLPSASLGRPHPATGRAKGLFEPIHGSAPDLAGKDVANPIGAILSAALLLRHSLGLEEEASAIEDAVDATLAAGPLTGDVACGGSTATTTQVGDAVVACILAGAGAESNPRTGVAHV